MAYAKKITLLGGEEATVRWTDTSEEAEIIMSPAFASYIHGHTVADAKAKANRFLPDHVTVIHCITA